MLDEITLERRLVALEQVVSDLQRKIESKLTSENWLQKLIGSISDETASVISLHEQFLGAHNFINRARTNTDVIRGYNLLLEILQGFAFASVLPFDAEAIAIFDELRGQKVRVSTIDLRIAAIAISRNLVLLTRNLSDFSKVPSLVTED